MNIEGMGDALVNQLVETGMVKDVADIYKLTEADLLKLERMGKKSADNILREIKQSKEAPLERVIYGLGIRFVGERTAQFLAEHFGSIDALMNASEEELQEVNEIGPSVSASIREFFDEPKNVELVERLRKAGLQFTGEKKRRGTTSRGQNVCADGNARTAHARPSQEADRRCRRQSRGIGQQEDGLRCRRHRSRIETGQGAGVGCRGD